MDSRYKDYYIDFNTKIGELENLEKKIKQELNSFKQKTGDKSSTYELENQIKSLLKKYKELHSTFEIAYSRKNIPGGMPELTIDSRQKKIQTFLINYNEMEKYFHELEKEKYKFKDEITEDYSQKAEYKDLTAQELIVIEKNKLKEQDQKMDDIVIDAKKGAVLAENVHVVAKEQNKQIAQINEDMDRNKDNMDKLSGRFEKYVAGFSMCKMVFALVIELIIAVACIILILL